MLRPAAYILATPAISSTSRRSYALAGPRLHACKPRRVTRRAAKISDTLQNPSLSSMKASSVLTIYDLQLSVGEEGARLNKHLILALEPFVLPAEVTFHLGNPMKGLPSEDTRAASALLSQYDMPPALQPCLRTISS